MKHIFYFKEKYQPDLLTNYIFLLRMPYRRKKRNNQRRCFSGWCRGKYEGLGNYYTTLWWTNRWGLIKDSWTAVLLG